MEPMTMFGIGTAVSAGTQLLGNLLNRDTVSQTNKQNYEMSKEFAQNSVRWRVADAKKAGINPLAALGMNASYAPSAQASTSGDYGLSGAGQAIGRAMQSMAYQQMQAQLEGQLLANQEKALEIEGQYASLQKNQIPADTIHGKKQINVQGLSADSYFNLFSLGETGKKNEFIMNPNQNSWIQEALSEGGVSGALARKTMWDYASQVQEILERRDGMQYELFSSGGLPAFRPKGTRDNQHWTEKYSPGGLLDSFANKIYGRR